MDMSLRRSRPREVPVEKPSAVQSYVPKVLLRQEERDGKRRWMPNERKPGASKHLQHNQQDVMNIKVDMNEYCSEAEVGRLRALEAEVRQKYLLQVAIMEGEMDKFVEEFYVAAAIFSTQVSTQKPHIDRLRSPQSKNSSK